VEDAATNERTNESNETKRAAGVWRRRRRLQREQKGRGMGWGRGEESRQKGELREREREREFGARGVGSGEPSNYGRGGNYM
jgi:hypothetical protein